MSFHRSQMPTPKKRWQLPVKLALVVIVFVALTSTAVYGLSHMNAPSKASSKTTAATTHTNTGNTSSTKSNAQPVAAINYCAENTLSQNVLVSISKQHLWACDGAKVQYDSPVVTGMESYAADLTPIGTYHIQAKQTNIHLKGCDATGCWDDPVSYWMLWLDNQYGQYGFHDATWRNPSQFGKVNINAPDSAAVVGSHGCVELPLTTAKWIYNWAAIGTTVTIES
jgi:lipoprotein-anchoring transpeptidase ErfK/SrfK